jgi:peptidoglycan/LPS O-acetylase OafA/YrhL
MSISGQRENRPLTALRGVASVWVVGHHIQPFWFANVPPRIASVLWMGHTAVDIFFVLSGFILACVYGALPLDRAPLFWLRRICRIYPLHLAVLGTFGGIMFGAVLLGVSRSSHDWGSLGLGALLLQPFLTDLSSWNPPTWSLGIELLCYAVFPAVALLFGRARVWILAAMAIASAVAESSVLHHYDGTVAGLGAALRGLAGFNLGVMLGWLSPRLRPSWATPASLVAAAGFVAGSVLDSPAAVTLAAAVLIFTLSADRGPVAWLLATRGTVWLGRVSFSIYVLHAPLLTLLQRIPIPGGEWSHLMLFLAILLPMSELTYRWIEQPGRRIPDLRHRAPILGPVVNSIGGH